MSRKIFRSFFVLILIGLATVQDPQPAHAAGPWYVAPTGDDNNDCLGPVTPCATINGALAKPGFVPGDTVRVAIGTYTGTGNEVVLLDKDVTLTGGWEASFTTQSGMTILDGQGIRRGATVNSGLNAIVEHFAVQNGSAISGGGISNSGNLTLNASVVSGNTTTNFTYGGGIYNAGFLTILNSTIKDNLGDYQGGGVYNSGNLILTSSTVTNNSITYYSGEGGGIKNAGTLLLGNSTVSGNTAPGGRGGGISNDGTSTINNSTITGNQTTDGGGISNIYGLDVTLRNSVLAGNTAINGPDCFDNSDFSGSIVSAGYNLIGDTTLCSFTSSTGDLPGVDPLLGPLQNNGGPTFTHALLPGSPAIDAGNPSGCTDPNGNPLTADQRGVTRPQGARCDIGAFEFEGGSEVMQVTIDILPGSRVNTINLKHDRLIPVAILSTADFAAPEMVDRDSLTFGKTGDENSLVFCLKHGIKVNRDRLPDLVCYFTTSKTGFELGDTEGILKGMTVENISFQGSDSVKILKKSAH